MLREKASFWTLLFLVTTAACFGSSWNHVPGCAQEITPDLYGKLEYRHIGPVGNRVISVVGVPGDPLVCYIGAASGGIFKSTDGGINWEPIFDDQAVSSIGSLAIAPSDSNVVWAGTGETFIRSNISQGNGIYRSTDAGKTWSHMGLGKTGRNGGENWKHVNHDHSLLNRTHYYTRCVVAADDYNEVYFPATRFHMTLDGGETIRRFNPVGYDHHDMWIDPLMPDRMMVGNDDGASISSNRGRTWIGAQLPIAQMYHVAVDNQIPYYVYGNMQDGPSHRGPSNSLVQGGISSGMWHSVGGCECGQAIPDPVENNIVWSGCYDGLLERYDLETGHSRPVTVWPESIQFWEAAEAKYRFQWTFPIVISPHNHEKVYVGSQYVHQTTNGGHSWTIISPDLSTNDKSKQQRAGGFTPDDEYYACVVFAIAESPLEEGLIWAGTNDGLVQVTRDGGTNWANVTGNIPDLPKWGTVSNLEPSRYDAGACYLTMDFHQVNNRDPFVYKTTDYGQSWKNLSSDIPRSELSYAHCVREDPVRKGLLYLGTENALYLSWDDGTKWYPLQNNLPHAPVHWLTIQEHFNDLVVGTYGRGFWIMDDITPFQQINPEVLESEAHLFELRPAYRFRNIEPPISHPNDLQALLGEDKNAEPMLAASEEFEQKLIVMQDHFYNVRLTYNSDQRWRERFYTRYCHLASSIGQSDFPPTTQQVEVHEVFKKRLASYQDRFNELLNKDLPDFNNLLEENNIPNIIAAHPY